MPNKLTDSRNLLQTGQILIAKIDLILRFVDIACFHRHLVTRWTDTAVSVQTRRAGERHPRNDRHRARLLGEKREIFKKILKFSCTILKSSEHFRWPLMESGEQFVRFSWMKVPPSEPLVCKFTEVYWSLLKFDHPNDALTFYTAIFRSVHS